MKRKSQNSVLFLQLPRNNGLPYRVETFIHRISERLRDSIRKKAIVARVKPPQKGEVGFIRTPPLPNKTSYQV